MPWTTPNRDICGPNDCRNPTHAASNPRFQTRQKVRWDDEWLYIAAELEEPQVWANNTKHDCVVFADNDYEVFISADGSSHYYKEYEMSAGNANWDLCLNKAYLNGGYENSSRVFGAAGFDELSRGLLSATAVHGCSLNRPNADGSSCRGWTAEVRMPLAAVALNNSVSVPPKSGSYWRINFSRVEWKVKTMGKYYEFVGADTGCNWTWPEGCAQAGAGRAGAGCATNPGNNWVWAPTGVVDIHLPEYWGYLQFSDAAVNTTAVAHDPDWTIRSVAMQLYYAQLAYFSKHSKYTADLAALAPLAPKGPRALEGNCTQPPRVTLLRGAQGYRGIVTARVADGEHDARSAVILDDRHLNVVPVVG